MEGMWNSLPQGGVGVNNMGTFKEGEASLSVRRERGCQTDICRRRKARWGCRRRINVCLVTAGPNDLFLFHKPSVNFGRIISGVLDNIYSLKNCRTVISVRHHTAILEGVIVTLFQQWQHSKSTLVAIKCFVMSRKKCVGWCISACFLFASLWRFAAYLDIPDPGQDRDKKKRSVMGWWAK